MSRVIRNFKFDSLLLTGVGIWATVIAFILNSRFDMSAWSDWYWLLLVVSVDVSHVYSSMYRTYFSADGRREYRTLLIWVPLICFAVAFALGLMGPQIFWRVLVYVAVYHFIKQQVGFVRLYRAARWTADEAMVWVSTLGSILIWHMTPEKTIRWFTKNDFVSVLSDRSDLRNLLKALLPLLFVAYLLRKLFEFFRRKDGFEFQAFILTAATFVSWYGGIVLSDSDFIFTFTNVLTHGVPYMALVWHTQKEQDSVFAHVGVFFFILLIIGFVEEGFWDALIWREHPQFFDAFYGIGPALAPYAVAAALALLILPQLTHYVLDGFIWKSSGQKRIWSATKQ